jgi:hypothetical protein
VKYLSVTHLLWLAWAVLLTFSLGYNAGLWLQDEPQRGCLGKTCTITIR